MQSVSVSNCHKWESEAVSVGDEQRRQPFESPRLLYHNIWKWTVWSYFDRGPGTREETTPFSQVEKPIWLVLPDEGIVGLQQNWVQIIQNTVQKNLLMGGCCTCGWFTLVPLAIKESNKFKGISLIFIEWELCCLNDGYNAYTVCFM